MVKPVNELLQKYNPDKIASLPAVLVKYKGNENKLFAAMIKKYGPEPSVMDMLDEEELSPGEADDDETGAAEDEGEENGEEKATARNPQP